MESQRDREAVGTTPEAELAAVRRALHRPHVEYPAPPWWVWPLQGLVVSAYTASFALDQPWPGLILMFGALFVSFGLIVYITRMRGNFPDVRTMPTPLRNEMISTWIQVIALGLLVIATWAALGVVPAVVFAGVAYTGIMYLHQRRHDAIASLIIAASDDDSSTTALSDSTT